MSGPVKPSGACDRECVERWLLLHHPACLPGANGVKQAPHEVSARKRDSLVGKMPTRPQGAALAGVDRFDRVGRADYPAGLDVVFQERHELRQDWYASCTIAGFRSPHSVVNSSNLFLAAASDGAV